MVDTYDLKTSDRHYRSIIKTFTKRTLHRTEFDVNNQGKLIVPIRDHKYLINECAALKYIANHTTIKVPRVLSFSLTADRQCTLTLERISGIQLENVPEHDRPLAMAKAIAYVEEVVLPQLRAIRSTQIGGLSGYVLVPEDVRLAAPQITWGHATDVTASLVLCHNDLAQHNILVDPETYEVTAILDWEYSGFYPKQFERPLWMRLSTEPWNEQEAHNCVELLQSLQSTSRPEAHGQQKVDG